MDSVAGAAIRWNVDAIKEPRGFIKFIEFIIAIFAFATTTSSSSSSSFTIDCNGTDTLGPYILTWKYPFKLHNINVPYDACNGSHLLFNPYGDFSAPSQFYVFVGIMAFIYSIGAVILYVCFDDKYRQFDKIPIFDFLATCAFVLMWLISASTWASGVSDIKLYTDPAEWKDIIPICASGACNTVRTGNFASLNVSIIFGFLNMAVWGGNLWFLYKETKWFKVETEHPETSPSETPQRV